MNITPTDIERSELQLIMTIEEGREFVAAQLGLKLSRRTFYNWRKHLNWVGGNFSALDPLVVDALVVFGEHRAIRRRSKAIAKNRTIKFLKEQNNV